MRVIEKYIKSRARNLIESLKNKKLKNTLLQTIPFWLASMITGVLAVIYAKLFALSEGFTFYMLHTLGAWMFLISPLTFVLAWWLVQKFAPYSRGSGIPQVMAAVELVNPRNASTINKLLSVRVIFIKVASSILMVLGGGAIGREGPTIQIAGSIFRKVNELLPSWWPKISRQNIIMTGSAAGLAAAFNTPLGGVVFAIEELTKLHFNNFKTAIFAAVIIAGLIAETLTGPYLYLGYPEVGQPGIKILAAVILVAAIAGMLGSALTKFILMLFNWKTTFKAQYQHILYLIACSLIIVSIAYFFSDKIMGSGKETMTSLLFAKEKIISPELVFYRVLGPILSFSTGAAGGIFAPALSAGCTVGAFISGIFHFSAGSSNLLMLAGMVALLTGITRTPFTAAILVLEMSNRHNLILHFMLAGLVSSFFP